MQLQRVALAHLRLVRVEPRNRCVHPNHNGKGHGVDPPSGGQQEQGQVGYGHHRDEQAEGNDAPEFQCNRAEGGAETMLLLAGSFRVDGEFIKHQDALGFRAQHLSELRRERNCLGKCHFVSSGGWLRRDLIGVILVKL
ncbi:hypothetical protein D9M72_600180 [compost metagenome]